MPTNLHPIPALSSVTRLAEPGDNVAVAVRQLDAGERFDLRGKEITLPWTVLEGHRLAIQRIEPGDPLLSWGLPFGYATHSISPGEYICNDKMLSELAKREWSFPLPETANFRDHFQSFEFDENQFQPGSPDPSNSEPLFFDGFDRGPSRGAGTRNHIVVIGVSSLASSFVREIAEHCRAQLNAFPNIDGVVPVAHTEGAGADAPHNLDLVLRTLAGYAVHPNTGAVLFVDHGAEPINGSRLRDYMDRNGYDLSGVPHDFVSFQGAYRSTFAKAVDLILNWRPDVNRAARTQLPANKLKIALQCGGSDAFSGISANPLAGWIARQVIQAGGAANLAETDELIGAEPYILQNVRDLETARRFLAMIDRFEQRAEWHGGTAQGNPSGGNLLRGLYNIVIKSIGAARKRDPAVRLDHVIEYGEPITAPGLHFMDSPGNDLESIAGQVASGCNLILFTTGNGSVTNFPFVPTIKIMTNSGRFALLKNEMDINAGRYLAGESMESLGSEALDLALRVASGERTAGERAGHSQVQIWRDWRFDEKAALPPAPSEERSGDPLIQHDISAAVANDDVMSFRNSVAQARRDIGLIVPTSLCAGQVGRLIASRLNQSAPTPARESSRKFVAIPHTEGCGISDGETETLLFRTLTGYLRHPLVGQALLLEHGCEKTHNASFRRYFQQHHLSPDQFGWASIQLDGGFDKVTKKVADWFGSSPRRPDPPTFPRIAIAFPESLPSEFQTWLNQLIEYLLDQGAAVILDQNGAQHAPDVFAWIQSKLPGAPLEPTLAYGQFVECAGLHVMEAPTRHVTETLSGLGATGAEIHILPIAGSLYQAHPFIPTLQIATTGAPILQTSDAAELDGVVDSSSGSIERFVQQLGATFTGAYQPKRSGAGTGDFQLTRGFTGISL